MRYSGFYIPTLRDDPKDVELVSHRLMLRAGMINQLGSGIYTKLPLFYRLFIKLWQIIREEMDRAGGNEMCFPAIHPSQLWRESGRWEAYGEDMFKFFDRHNREMCLAPTHEIAAAALVKPFVNSYRDLPIRIYQTQTKFRDEVRPRGGVMRTREFTMKDFYSYDRDVPSMNRSYRAVVDGYSRVCDRTNLKYVAVQTADTGQIGGDVSHEFYTFSPSGDETVYYCPNDFSASSNKKDEGKKCDVCGSPYVTAKGIEVGHCFQLGTQYSKVVDLGFIGDDGRRQYVLMCSYGIGLERTIAAVIEQNYDQRGIVWPAKFSPFEVAIARLQPDPDMNEYAESLYKQCLGAGLDALYDDRDVSPGEKLNDLDLIGIPLQIIVGRNSLDQGLVELKIRKTGSSQRVQKSDALQSTVQTLAELRRAEDSAHVSLVGKVYKGGE